MKRASSARSWSDIFKIPRVLLETLAVHEALRRCGFRSDDIYVQLEPAGNPEGALLAYRPDGPDMNAAVGTLMVHVTLRAQGKEFTITVGRWCDSEETLKLQWEAAVAWFNSAPTHEAMPTWESSVIAQNILTLVEGLSAKGFKVPALGVSVSSPLN